MTAVGPGAGAAQEQNRDEELGIGVSALFMGHQKRRIRGSDQQVHRLLSLSLSLSLCLSLSRALSLATGSPLYPRTFA